MICLNGTNTKKVGHDGFSFIVDCPWTQSGLIRDCNGLCPHFVLNEEYVSQPYRGSGATASENIDEAMAGCKNCGSDERVNY